MKFFVPISLSSYLLFYAIICLIALAIGVHVLVAVLCIGFIYILFKEPLTTVVALAVAVSVKYPALALPLFLIVVVLIAGFTKLSKIKKGNELEVHKINDGSAEDPKNDKQS